MLKRTRKITLVVFITILIWVWADLALNEEYPDIAATIVAQSTDHNLLATFNKNVSVSVKITLSGSAAKIAEVQRDLRRGSAEFKFYFDPAQQKMEQSGNYQLDVLGLLQKSTDIRKQGLKVVSCQPDTVDVTVVQLVQRSLPVECFDENLISIKVESIEPPRVDMPVREDWAGEKLGAIIQLTAAQIEQARLASIIVKPFVELEQGIRRYAASPVAVKLPPMQEKLQEYLVPTTIGLVFSENIEGKYRVEIENRSEISSTVKIKATEEAQAAYQKAPFKMILDIQDGDETAVDPITRELIPNFPREYVRKDEIILNQQPVKARFKLIPLQSPPQPVQ